MVDLNVIQNTLNSNTYLSNDIKENLMELIIIFNNSFSGVDLTNLNERLKTLNIVKGSKFIIKGSSKYDPVNNQLLFSTSKLENLDIKHVLMRELLNIITAKENFTGFNQSNLYEAFNIGYTEILANYLVGNECECEYEDEVITTNMLITVIGNENIQKAYFSNDISLIMSAIC